MLKFLVGFIVCCIDCLFVLRLNLVDIVFDYGFMGFLVWKFCFGEIVFFGCFAFCWDDCCIVLIWILGLFICCYCLFLLVLLNDFGRLLFYLVWIAD